MLVLLQSYFGGKKQLNDKVSRFLDLETVPTVPIKAALLKTTAQIVYRMDAVAELTACHKALKNQLKEANTKPLHTRCLQLVRQEDRLWLLRRADDRNNDQDRWPRLLPAIVTVWIVGRQQLDESCWRRATFHMSNGQRLCSLVFSVVAGSDLS